MAVIHHSSSSSSSSSSPRRTGRKPFSLSPTLFHRRSNFHSWLLTALLVLAIHLYHTLTVNRPLLLLSPSSSSRCTSTNLEHNDPSNFSTLQQRRRQQQNTDVVVDDPYHILPKVLYVVFGLESSGTTFMTDTLAKALDLPVKLRAGHDTVESTSKRIHIQHISLPMGAAATATRYDSLLKGEGYEESDGMNLPFVDVFWPKRCHNHDLSMNEGDSMSTTATTTTQYSQVETPEVCRSFIGPTMSIPKHSSRYFVNITAHIRWYRDHNVLVYPILVVRDPIYRFQSVLEHHCHNETVAIQQYEIGQRLIEQSIEQFSEISSSTSQTPSTTTNHYDDQSRATDGTQIVNTFRHNKQPPLVLVSYESLMTLGSTYLTHMIYPQLGIYSNHNDNIDNSNKNDNSDNTKKRNDNTNVYTPMLKNGNLKYSISSSNSNARTFTDKARISSPRALTNHLLRLEQPVRDSEQRSKEILAGKKKSRGESSELQSSSLSGTLTTTTTTRQLDGNEFNNRENDESNHSFLRDRRQNFLATSTTTTTT